MAKRETGRYADINALVAEWIETLREAYRLAYGERMVELRDGRRSRLMDDRGLHPYSVVWGKILHLEAEVLPVLVGNHAESPEWSDGGTFTLFPGELRDAARADASRDFGVEMARIFYLEQIERGTDGIR